MELTRRHDSLALVATRRVATKSLEVPKKLEMRATSWIKKGATRPIAQTIRYIIAATPSVAVTVPPAILELAITYRTIAPITTATIMRHAFIDLGTSLRLTPSGEIITLRKPTTAAKSASSTTATQTSG